MTKTKRIIICGTHHTPAIELINILKRDKKTQWEIHYVGHQYATESHIIHTIIPKLNVKFYNVNCGKFDRKNIDKTILGIPTTLNAFFQANKLIRQIKPDIVVSFGGYVSVPVIVAAALNKIPSITHEQTLTISLSTKINSFFATKVATSFPHKNTIFTGNLIREEIFNLSSTKFIKLKRPIIYITGGGQGSTFINQLTYQLVPKLSPSFSIIHQTGKNIDPITQDKLQKSYPNYFPVEYVDTVDIGWVLNNSNQVISRSGANICQELDILDKASILIPLPFTQQNEQEKNADWLLTQHPSSTVVIPQKQTAVDTILKYISNNIHVSHPKSLPTNHPLFKLINETTL